MSIIFWIIIAIGGFVLLVVLLLAVLAFASFTTVNVQSAGAPLRLILPFLS